ncbi:MAG: hypothetical protein RR690_09570, partial [Longicatena sp.]
MADALSTALYMMTYEEGLAYVNDFNTKFPDRKIDVMWVTSQANQPDWYKTDDYAYMFTDNLKQYSKNAHE